MTRNFSDFHVQLAKINGLGIFFLKKGEKKEYKQICVVYYRLESFNVLF